MKKETKLSESSMMSSDLKNGTPNIKVLYATECNLQNWLNKKTCSLVDNLQIYNKKVAARADKCAKCIETLIKTYQFDNRIQTRVLRLLAQLKRSCN